MLNLIFDGNYFVHRIFMVLDKRLQISQDGLIEIFLKNFVYAIKPFVPISNRIVFTVDHSSWRKSVEEVDYKGNRDKSESPIDWDLFYKNYEKFQSKLSESGVIINRVPGAEADDLIYLWSQHLISKGQNSIIFTGDSDLRQLVEYNGNNWNIIADPTHKKSLYVTQEFLDNYLNSSDISIFEMSNNVVQNILRDSEYSNDIDIIDPYMVLIHKILSGDKSDNIPSVYYRPAGGIGEASANKIINRFMKRYNYNDLTKIDTEMWCKRMTKIIFSKFNISDISKTELISKLKRNRKLIYLNNKYIPSGIVDASEKEIQQYQDTRFKNLKHLEPKKISKTKLYETKDMGKDYNSVDDFGIDGLNI